jgi:hypothetical protein
MDTMKLLLGATIALLLGALAVSWQGMKTSVKQTPRDEMARLEKQIKELRVEQDKLQIERQKQLLQTPSPIELPVNNAKTNFEMEAMKLQISENKRALAEIEMQKELDKRDKKVDQDEEGLIAQRGLEGKDSELRRARMISEALLIGRVKEFVEDAQYGGFITFEVIMPEQVQPGVIVAIRRKTGILAQFKVSETSSEGAIANPLPGFSQVAPQIGDELILPPQY